MGPGGADPCDVLYFALLGFMGIIEYFMSLRISAWSFRVLERVGKDRRAKA